MIFILGLFLFGLGIIFFLKQQIKVHSLRKGKFLGYHNYYRKHKYDQKRWQELK